MLMSFHNSNYEFVELTENAKEKFGHQYVPRPNYTDYPTKAVAILTFGETKDDLWIQQRPPTDSKPLYWEIVAGSKAAKHDSIEDAAREEVKEELFGYDLDEAPENFDLDYVGNVCKPTENPQQIYLFAYNSGRNGFPESDEVYRGEFVSIDQLAQKTDRKDFTDCSMYALEAMGFLDSSDDYIGQVLENEFS